MDIKLQVGVKAFLKNKDGKYLVLRRSPKEYPGVVGAGMWDIVGGRIEPGVPLMENLKREIKEEAGLEFSGEAKLIDATDILRVPGLHVVRLTFVSKIDEEPKIDNFEILEYRWLSIAEMKKFDDIDIYTKELINRVSPDML